MRPREFYTKLGRISVDHLTQICLLCRGATSKKLPIQRPPIRAIAMTEPLQSTSAIRALFDDHVTFWEMPSGYRVPPHLMPILQTALDKHREVKVTFEGLYSISAVEIMPPPSSALAQLREAIGGMRAALMRLPRA